MGFVYNRKVGRSYISNPSCKKTISLQSARKKLTSQRVRFLKELGLKAIPCQERRENGH